MRHIFNSGSPAELVIPKLRLSTSMTKSSYRHMKRWSSASLYPVAYRGLSKATRPPRRMTSFASPMKFRRIFRECSHRSSRSLAHSGPYRRTHMVCQDDQGSQGMLPNKSYLCCCVQSCSRRRLTSLTSLQSRNSGVSLNQTFPYLLTTLERLYRRFVGTEFDTALSHGFGI